MRSARRGRTHGSPNQTGRSAPLPEFHDIADTNFAIELEFFLLYPLSLFQTQPWQNEESPGVAFLSQKLGQAGLPVENSGHPDAWTVENVNRDLRDSEASLMPNSYGSVPIRLSSPSYRFDQEHSWSAQIQKLLFELKRLARYGVDVVTNVDTGFHVHVGNEQAPISLRTAKTLLQLVTGFERCFDVLHTKSRIKHKHEFCAPPSRFFLLRSNDPGDWLQLIEGIQSHSSMRQLFVVRTSNDPDDDLDGTASAYNFDNLDPGQGTTEQMIEFRQHAGTLDFKSIIIWVKLCAHLVHICALMPRYQIKTLVEDNIYRPRFCLFDLFESLEVPNHVVEFYRTRLGIRKSTNGMYVNIYNENHRSSYFRRSAGGPNDPWRAFWEALEQKHHSEHDSQAVVQAMVKKFNRFHYGVWPGVDVWAGPRLPDLGGPLRP